MFADQMLTVVTGLAVIIPAIFVLRWLLTHKTGSPDDVAAHHLRELEARYRRGEIDEATYQRHREHLEQE
ncbi:MAG: hypothetical protein Kow006_20560 [Gammaproteobacteria bacterium]